MHRITDRGTFSVGEDGQQAEKESEVKEEKRVVQGTQQGTGRARVSEH